MVGMSARLKASAPAIDPAVFAAKDRLERGANLSRLRHRSSVGCYRGGIGAIGRISMQPSTPLHAVGIFAAHAIASSRFSQSRM